MRFIDFMFAGKTLIDYTSLFSPYDFEIQSNLLKRPPAHKTTTRLRRPVLSSPKPIPIQSLLYKTTTCLTRPATTFFVSKMKKWKQCLKNKCLSDYIYSIATL